MLGLVHDNPYLSFFLTRCRHHHHRPVSKRPIQPTRRRILQSSSGCCTMEERPQLFYTRPHLCACSPQNDHTCSIRWKHRDHGPDDGLRPLSSPTHSDYRLKVLRHESMHTPMQMNTWSTSVLHQETEEVNLKILSDGTIHILDMAAGYRVSMLILK